MSSCSVVKLYINSWIGDEKKRRKKAFRHSADSPSIIDNTQPQLGSISLANLTAVSLVSTQF